MLPLHLENVFVLVCCCFLRCFLPNVSASAASACQCFRDSFSCGIVPTSCDAERFCVSCKQAHLALPLHPLQRLTPYAQVRHLTTLYHKKKKSALSVFHAASLKAAGGRHEIDALIQSITLLNPGFFGNSSLFAVFLVISPTWNPYYHMLVILN